VDVTDAAGGGDGVVSWPRVDMTRARSRPCAPIELQEAAPRRSASATSIPSRLWRLERLLRELCDEGLSDEQKLDAIAQRLASVLDGR
jgi:hypothetical protein